MHTVHGTRAGPHLQEPFKALPRKEDITWECLGSRVMGIGCTVVSSLREVSADPQADLTQSQSLSYSCQGTPTKCRSCHWLGVGRWLTWLCHGPTAPNAKNGRSVELTVLVYM